MHNTTLAAFFQQTQANTSRKATGGSCTCSIEWWHCWWPWVKPNCPQTTWISTFALPFCLVELDFKFGKYVDHSPRMTTNSQKVWSVMYKGSPYSITEHRVLELIPVLGSQPTGDVSHKRDSRLPLLSARPAVTPATPKRAATNFATWWTMGVSSLSKTVTRQHRDCNFNPGPSMPESSTLTNWLPSHPSCDPL